MRKCIKFSLLSVLTICLVIIFFLVCRYVIPYYYYHGGNSSGEGLYAHETVVRNDMYVLKTSIGEVDGMEVITFHIENKNGDIVYSDDGYWRTWDFKKIYFAENSNDVIVETGDTGDTIFYYENGTWVWEGNITEVQGDLTESNTLPPWHNWGVQE